MAIGRPITETPNIADKIVSTLATAGQTEFTVTGGYRVNHLAVFRNGVRLVTGRDYIAGDGLTVELLEDAALNDVLEFQVFDTFSISDAIVGNSTSQTLTGDLTVNGTFTVGASGIGTMVINTMDVGIITSRTGIVTFNNTTASTSSSTGAAQFKGGVGIAKSLFVGGNISAGGTLTYEDVTNVDSVGLVTAGKGLRVTTGGLIVTAGISTFAGITTVTNTAALHSKQLNVSAGSTFGGAVTASDTLTVAGNLDIADKIIHTGDTNTALRFPAADTITAETGGSERLRIDSGGNVTLGTSSVAFPSGGGLQVYHASVPRIKLSNSTSGTAAGDGFQIYTNSSSVYLDNKENGEMRFYTNGTEKMRLTAAGKVGINSTTFAGTFAVKNLDDANNNVLECYNDNGNLSGSFSQSSAGDGTIGANKNDGTLSVFFRSNGVSYINGGNLGIGCASPSQLLEINGSSNPCVLVKDTTNDCITYLYSQDSVATVGSASAHDLVFNVSNGEKARIDTSGRVGINHSSPTAKLDIVEAASTPAVKIKSGTSTNQNTHITLYNDNDGGTLAFGVFGSGASTHGAITATDGFVTSNQELVLASQNASGAIKFGLGATPTEKMYIDINGYLGMCGYGAPDTALSIKLTGQAASGSDDASDWGAAGIVNMYNTDGGTANSEVLLLGSQTSGVGQISSGFGFGRHNTSDWGTYLSFKTHGANTSNIDEISERGRITSDGRFQFGDESVSNRTSYRTQLSAGNANVLSLQNPSSSDGADIQMSFWARNSNNAAVEYARIIAQAEETQANSTQKGHLRFGINASGTITEMARLTSSGYLGLGSGSNTNKPLHIYRTTDDAEIRLQTNSGTEQNSYIALRQASGNLEFYTVASGTNMMFHTVNNERMRILDDGGIVINSTSRPVVGTEQLGVAGGGASNAVGIAAGCSHNDGIPFFASNSSNTTDMRLMRFAAGSGGDTRGTIIYNGSAMVYGGTSDYRLKENITAISNGITKLKNLNPVNFNWIKDTDDKNIMGFLAHEVQEVMPESVTGTKDAVDSEGNPEYQEMDYGRISPLLTAALQEAIGKIEVLEAKVAALESA